MPKLKLPLKTPECPFSPEKGEINRKKARNEEAHANLSNCHASSATFSKHTQVSTPRPTRVREAAALIAKVRYKADSVVDQ